LHPEVFTESSVKVSVEPSVKVKAMGSFGNVMSSEKTLAFIGKISYICAGKLTVKRR
jgi:hypothetical protein